MNKQLMLMYDKKDYDKSNKITSVKLSKFKSDNYLSVLNAKNSSERYEASVKLLDYLCDKFKIERIAFSLLDKPRKCNNRSQIYGFYVVGCNQIKIYNKTAKTLKMIAPKTYMETLLHEFIHHYDMKVIKLTTSLHTGGFYKRITDLNDKLKN